MSVYVDALFDVTPEMVTGRWPYGKACHLTADTREELEAMARQLGLKPAWIQHKRRPTEHYDLTPGKRLQAIRLGAREITVAESVALTRAKQAAMP